LRFVVHEVPEAGLEPTTENTGIAPDIASGGNTGGNIAPNSAFNTALIESGFSPAEVTRILSALNEAGLAVVAMGSGVWED